MRTSLLGMGTGRKDENYVVSDDVLREHFSKHAVHIAVCSVHKSESRCSLDSVNERELAVSNDLVTKTWRKTMKTLAMTILALTLSASAQTFNTLYTFTQQSANGTIPSGQLTLDAQGNLYGSTYSGGAGGSGTVFELTPSGNGTWTDSVLYSFGGAADGGEPNSGLIFDAAGNIYGTGMIGGKKPCVCGVVFELSPVQGVWDETVLHDFNEKGGASPTTGLTFDSAGNLYGTTSLGGTSELCSTEYDCGTIFELSPDGGSWKFSTIYEMNYLAYRPDGPLVVDSSGNLYGTAMYGEGMKEHRGDGVAFKLAPVNGKWNHAFIHIFDSFYREPSGGLSMDQTGALYGTTTTGGLGFAGGEAYQITGGTKWSLKTIKPFTQAQGHPTSSLVMDANGNLYGATTGGANGYGMIYRLAAGTWKYTDLYDFPITNPAPYGNLIVDTQGNVYGVTSGDGVNTFGSVWEYQP